MADEGFPNLTPAQLAQAEAAALTADHYASAFKHAARIIRVRARLGQSPEQIAAWFDQKVRTEADFSERIRKDPAIAIFPEY